MTEICGVEIPYTTIKQGDGIIYVCNNCQKVLGFTHRLLEAYPFQVLDWLEHHAERCGKDGTGVIPGATEIGGAGGGGEDTKGAQEEVAGGN